MQYFNHDTSSSSDDKIIALRMFFGHGAVDAYWAIVERIHHDEKPLSKSKYTIGAIAQIICETADNVKAWVDGMVDIGLLVETDDGYTSDRISANIRSYRERIEQSSAAGKASAAKRAQRKSNNRATNVEQPLNNRATNVEQPLNNRATNKIKDNKGGAEQREAQLLRPNFDNGEMAEAIVESGEDFDFDTVIHQMRTARL